MQNSIFFKICLFTAVLAALFSSTAVLAATDSIPYLTRGEATDLLVRFYSLEQKNRSFLDDCGKDTKTCLFTFAARSNFDNIRYKPLILYPDVYPAYRYYAAINLASELDLVSGYYTAENSPFRPEQPITRVEALKIVMNAAGLMNWKEKFELTNDQNTWLSFSFDGDKWWYGRYLAAALQKGVLKEVTREQADSNINEQEFMDIMENANKIVASGQTMSPADNYGQANNKADTSENPAL